jgi:hypothetical protein
MSGLGYQARQTPSGGCLESRIQHAQVVTTHLGDRGRPRAPADGPPGTTLRARLNPRVTEHFQGPTVTRSRCPALLARTTTHVNFTRGSNGARVAETVNGYYKAELIRGPLGSALEECRRRRARHPRLGPPAQHPPAARLPRGPATRRVREAFYAEKRTPAPGRSPMARVSIRPRAIHRSVDPGLVTG